MAEAFVELLIENLSSLIQGNIGLIIGVQKEMLNLLRTLNTIQAVLEDVEEKQFQSKAIQTWLSKLNDVAYEVDDILDECAIVVPKLEIKASKLTLKKISSRLKIRRRMKEVAEKLDAIAADRHHFHLREVIIKQRSQVDWKRKTGSVVHEPDHIYGRDEDREKIVDLLVNQVADRDQLSVLPITAVGGLGKTTLAQLVYDDERVSLHFDTKLWVCVSDHFDLKILLKEIIEAATATSCASDLMSLSILEGHLQEALNQKRYLLILDDVWNESMEKWLMLKNILACGLNGSSIVVTTRLQMVANIMGTLPTYCLKGLSEVDCWLLFRQRAFGQENEQLYPKLDSIGRQMVKKCAGLPLAVKALGSLLRFNRGENEWIHVKESEIWDLQEEILILPSLILSYLCLPSILRLCFAYCAVFPKHYIIEKQDLIYCWIAHGYISSNRAEEVEDVGDQIWNEFILKSIFQDVKTTGTKTTCKMHDLFHDLAQSILQCRVHKAQMKGNTLVGASHRNIRELEYVSEHSMNTSSSNAAHVSTLTAITDHTHLRILKFESNMVEELPSAIGKLKHLRYLNLSGSSIHTLPHTLCHLRNLKFLILNNCLYLKSLPEEMRCMTNLRHILLEGCSSLSHMPSGIGELASLKTLCLFIVGEKIGNQLDELEHLNLGGRLEIKHLERVSSHLIAEKANLVGNQTFVFWFYVGKVMVHLSRKN